MRLSLPRRGAHVADGLDGDGGAIGVVLEDLPVDVARPLRVRLGDVHDGQHLSRARARVRVRARARARVGVRAAPEQGRG